MNNELTNLKYCEEALRIKNEIEVRFLELGEMLYEIRVNKLYEPQWSSFYEYCLEFKGLSPSTISKLINVYKKFVLEFNFPQGKLQSVGGWTLLSDISKKCNTKEEAEHWISKASVLTRNDLKKTVIMDGKEECKHKNTFTITICKDCGERWREYEPE